MRHKYADFSSPAGWANLANTIRYMLRDTSQRQRKRHRNYLTFDQTCANLSEPNIHAQMVNEELYSTHVHNIVSFSIVCS